MNRHKGFRVITCSSGASIRKALCCYGVAASLGETQCYSLYPAQQDLSRGWRRMQTAACAFLFLTSSSFMVTSLLSLPSIFLLLYLFSCAFSSFSSF